MSIALHVLAKKDQFPPVADWQSAIDRLGFGVKLDAGIDVFEHTGFLPCAYGTVATGFEFSIDSKDDLMASYPELEADTKPFDFAATFLWGGDMNECASATISAAVLTQISGGLLFDPQDGTLLDGSEAIERARLDEASLSKSLRETSAPLPAAAPKTAGRMRAVWLFCIVLALILVPFFLWEEPMNQFAAMVMAQRGAWWIGPALAGLLAADVFLPVPSSIVSTGAGVMLGFLGGAVTNIAGMTLGCWLGYRAGQVAKGQSDERLTELWSRYGEWTLILTRAVPVLAEAAVLFAGMTEMPMRRFLILTTLANVGIGVLYAAVGAFAMEWNSFLGAFVGSLLVPAAAQAIMRVGWRK